MCWFLTCDDYPPDVQNPAEVATKCEKESPEHNMCALAPGEDLLDA